MARRCLRGILAGGNGDGGIQLRLDGGGASFWLWVVGGGGVALTVIVARAVIVRRWILNFVIFVFILFVSSYSAF
jgi:hypothetical protein